MKRAIAWARLHKARILLVAWVLGVTALAVSRVGEMPTSTAPFSVTLPLNVFAVFVLTASLGWSAGVEAMRDRCLKIIERHLPGVKLGSDAA